MGGSPSLCSVIRGALWRTVFRRLACVACMKLIPAFVHSPLPPSPHHPRHHNLPIFAMRNVNACCRVPPRVLDFRSVSTETESVGREPSPTPRAAAFQTLPEAFLHSTPAPRNAAFPLEIASIVLELLCAVQWNKKGNCLYLGTMESLSAAAEPTQSGSSTLLKIIVLDHQPLSIDLAAREFASQI